MPDIMQLLAAHLQNDDEPGEEPSRPAADVQLMEIRAAFDRTQKKAADRFKVGDLVTPTSNSMAEGSGDPHIVIEIIEPPIRNLIPADSGSPRHGALLDMRVLSLFPNGTVCAHLVESWYFEAYSEGTDASTD